MNIIITVIIIIIIIIPIIIVVISIVLGGKPKRWQKVYRQKLRVPSLSSTAVEHTDHVLYNWMFFYLLGYL